MYIQLALLLGFEASFYYIVWVDVSKGKYNLSRKFMYGQKHDELYCK
jgi:hypothetical protein